MTVYFLLGGWLLAAPAVLVQSAAPVPAAVVAAFARAQPRATHVAWHPCPAGYEAAFVQDVADRVPGERKLRGQLTFRPTGELLETRLDVTYRALPPLGRTAVHQQYPQRQLDRIVRVIDERGVVRYETKICPGRDKDGQDRGCQTSYFDENGRPLSPSPP